MKKNLKLLLTPYDEHRHLLTVEEQSHFQENFGENCHHFTSSTGVILLSSDAPPKYFQKMLNVVGSRDAKPVSVLIHNDDIAAVVKAVKEYNNFEFCECGNDSECGAISNLKVGECLKLADGRTIMCKAVRSNSGWCSGCIFALNGRVFCSRMSVKCMKEENINERNVKFVLKEV